MNCHRNPDLWEGRGADGLFTAGWNGSEADDL